jgi:hypothetical protein
MSIKSGKTKGLIKLAKSLATFVISFPQGHRPEAVLKELESKGWMIPDTEQTLLGVLLQDNEVTCIHPVENEDEYEAVRSSALISFSKCNNSTLSLA